MAQADSTRKLDGPNDDDKNDNSYSEDKFQKSAHLASKEDIKDNALNHYPQMD